MYMGNDRKEELEQEENVDNSMAEQEECKTDEYIAKLTEELTAQKEKAEEYFDSLKRNMAEFDNFKKRMVKEKSNMYTSVVSDIFSDLLPVLDNFDQAMQNKCEDEKFKSGMEMIRNQFLETLTRLGLVEIEAKGCEFNPEFHEAVMHIEDKNYKEKEIVEVLRKGYKFQDKVIRHSMVKVAN